MFLPKKKKIVTNLVVVKVYRRLIPLFSKPIKILLCFNKSVSMLNCGGRCRIVYGR